MTLELLRLEWRRNRLSAAAAAASFLLTVIMVKPITSAAGLELARTVEAMLVGWALAGLPLAAALIGAAAGSGAGARDAAEAEGLLPLSPERRAAASLSVAVLLCALFAAFVLAVAGLLGSSAARMYAPAEKAWGDDFWRSLHLAPFLALAVLDLAAGSWAAARLLGHGVAGGMLALALTATTGLGLLAAYGLELVHADWGAGSALPAFLAACAGTLAKARAGALAARWRERRDGPRTGAAAAACLAFSAVACWALPLGELAALRGRVVILEDPPLRRYQTEHDRGPRGSAAAAAAGRGALVAGIDGSLHLATPDGLSSLTPSSRRGLWELLRDPFGSWIAGTWRDRDGVLWVERRESYARQIVRVADGEARILRLPPSDGASIHFFLDAPYKSIHLGGKRFAAAELGAYFEDPANAPRLPLARFLERRRAASGAARPECAGRCLRAAGRTWALPGTALSAAPVPPDEQDGRPLYLLPARTKDGARVLACRDDGRVGVAWPVRRTPRGPAPYFALPDGTLASFGPELTLWLLAPGRTNGTPVPLAAVRRTLRSRTWTPFVLRRAEGEVWLAWDDELVVVAEDGRLLRRRRLARGVNAVHPLAGGLFVQTRTGAYAADWDGATRRLRAAD